MYPVLGIDFGSHSSKVFVTKSIEEGNVLSLLRDDSTAPSALYFESRLSILGQSSPELNDSKPYGDVGSLKRLCGRRVGEKGFQEAESKFMHTPLINVDGVTSIEMKYQNSVCVLPITKLIATFLRKLYSNAAHEWTTRHGHADSAIPATTFQPSACKFVIAVPGWYSDVQRRAMLDAAFIADMGNVGLIDDTTAVGVYYATTHTDLPDVDSPLNVLFIDFGHSDSFVMVASFSKGRMVIKSVVLDANFGGRDIDYLLATHFTMRFKDAYGINVPNDLQTQVALLSECQRVKEALSEELEVHFHCGSVINTISGHFSVTRTVFESLIAEFLGRLFRLIHQALSEASISCEDIASVELLGSCAAIPSIKAHIQASVNGKGVSLALDRKQAIAQGAAYAGTMLPRAPPIRQYHFKGAISYPFEIEWDNISGPTAWIRDPSVRLVDNTLVLSRKELRLSENDSPQEITHLDVAGRASDEDIDLHHLFSQADSLLQLFPDTTQAHSRRTCLRLSGSLQHLKFRTSGKLQDLDEAITLYSEATGLLASDIDQEVDLLCLVGSSFQDRFERSMEIADLVEAASILEGAVSLVIAARDFPDKAIRLNYIGDLLELCGEKSAVIGHGSLTRYADILSKAVVSREAAVLITADVHPDKVKYLSKLAMSLGIRGQLRESVDDINNAIVNQEAALHLIPDNHPSKTYCLSGLADSLGHRWELANDVEDLNRAIVIWDDAIRITSDDHRIYCDMLDRLGDHLWARFQHSGDIKDVDQAIAHQEKAVEFSQGQEEDASHLFHLGRSLYARFQHYGDNTILDQAISTVEIAAQLIPEDSSTRPDILCTLSSAYVCRFELKGEVRDIDEAILHFRSITSMTPENQWKPLVLDALATMFQTRFRSFHDLTDLDEAILCEEEALRIMPADFGSRAMILTNYGRSLLRRNELRGNTKDLNQAVSMLEAVVELPSEYKPVASVYLAKSLRNKDLDKAIEYQALAVSARSDKNPHHLFWFGLYLLERFELQGRVDDEENAIAKFEDVMQILPRGHPTRTTCLFEMAKIFYKRHRRLINMADLERARDMFLECALAEGPPWLRLAGARSLLDLVLVLEDPPFDVILKVHALVIERMSRVAWLGVSPDPDHREFSKLTSGYVNMAASGAMVVGGLEVALGWLENGRSLLWSQTLKLRTPLDDLRRIRPDMAKRLAEVSQELEYGSNHPSVLAECALLGNFQAPFSEQVQSLPRHSKLSVPSFDREVQKQQQLNEEWERLIRQVREIPNFENFLLPVQYSQIREAAAQVGGPVVMINVSMAGCDALALVPSSEDLCRIHLSEFSSERAIRLNLELRQILVRRRLLSRGGERHGKQAPLHDEDGEDDIFRAILAELWNAVVKPVLDYLKFQPSPPGDLPRIWWCPTGPLTFLPLHAAGIYSVSANTATVSLADFAVSSYTPTLTALLAASKKSKPKTCKLLAVTQSNTPGEAPLPATKNELEIIQKHFSNDDIHTLEESEAIVSKVLSAMEEHSWVHLACHGGQNLTDPMKSGLALHDGHLALSEIIKKPLPLADFTFLSACQTASGDDISPDEAIHLAAGMLLAGYSRVIATMWSIKDKDAPLVADTVYSHLFKEGQPNSANSAHALHAATQRLRERYQGRSFASWVPFIHFGA